MIEIDFETRSPVDLRAHGVYRYFDHPNTQVMIASYEVDGGPVQRWRFPEACPDDIREQIEAGELVYAHNAQFERLAINKVLTKHGWPHLPVEQTRCTAAMAAAMSLPRDLDRLGRALGLSDQKDKEGHALMMRMCKDRKPRKGEDPNGLYWHQGWDDPATIEQLHAYCDQDVRTEAAARKVMMDLPASEWAVYHLNEHINDRGLRIDKRSALAAIELTDRDKERINTELTRITSGYVIAVSAVSALTEWVRERGVDIASLGRADVEDALAGDLPNDVRRVLELRQEGGKTTVAKVRAFLDRASADGRVRGAYVYHAAGTGRYSSRGAQVHNLARPRHIYGAALENGTLRPSTLFQAIRTEDPALIRAMYGSELGKPMHLVSDAIRGFIWAAPGHRFLAVDFAAIESRVNAWLAGDHDKIEAFRAFDRGEGPDMYKLAAQPIFQKRAIDITKDERQSGKVAELALGYQGGVSALLSMAKGYGLNLEAAYEAVAGSADEDVYDRAAARYEECLKRKEPATQVLSKRGWLAAELIKVGWRAGNRPIVDSWKAFAEAAFQAVRRPGEVVSVLKLQFRVARGFLWMRLPSDRCLAYAAPDIRMIDAPWADKEQKEPAREKMEAVTVAGTDSVTGHWRRYALYGGLLCENAVQAIARDCLTAAQLNTERAGYTNVGHTHDEVLAELPRGVGALDEFMKRACEMPGWADGLPVVGSGWEGKRYRKD